MALLSVAEATAGTILVWDRGRWNLGLITSPVAALRDTLIGTALAAVVIGGADLLVWLFADLRRAPGDGFPAGEVLAVFVPAVLHEELLFRGYGFQRVWLWNRWVAILGGAALFAAMHAGNLSVTPLALFNIFLGGILLSLAWQRYRRLWLPIGLHLAWNLMTGPILGYEVSGYVPDASILRTTVAGPEWLTGGQFGIEGSVCITASVVVAIGLLVWGGVRRPGAGAGPGPGTGTGFPATNNRNT